MQPDGDAELPSRGLRWRIWECPGPHMVAFSVSVCKSGSGCATSLATVPEDDHSPVVVVLLTHEGWRSGGPQVRGEGVREITQRSEQRVCAELYRQQHGCCLSPLAPWA